jgi:hypothetical protein
MLLRSEDEGRGTSTCGLPSDDPHRLRPLVKRQACLEILLERFGCPTVSLSEPFEDRDAPSRSGKCRD